MADDCIFCSIVAGDVPARTVAETDDVLAFLDANPMAPGHVLVIPKAHRERLADVPDDVAADLFGTLHELLPRVEAAVDADGATVGVNDGAAAGQEIDHAHAHVIPRFEGDGGGPIHVAAGDRPDVSDEEMDRIASAVESN